MSELKDDVIEYIEFYNNKSFHESLEYKKPMRVYRNSIIVNVESYNKGFDKNKRVQNQNIIKDCSIE